MEEALQMVKRTVKKRRKKKRKKIGIILFAVLIFIILAEVFVMFNDGRNASYVGTTTISTTDGNGGLATSSPPAAPSASTIVISPISPAPGQDSSPTTKPTGGVVSNTATSWYYMPAGSLFSDIKSTTNANLAAIVKKYDGIWQDATTQKIVYITMDTGENCNSNLDKIMAAAAKENVKITFFLTGTYIKSYPDMVKKMDSQGHLIANHTYTHPNLPEYLANKGSAAFLKELTSVADEYNNVTGKSMARILRPPGGTYSEKVFQMTYNMGYRLAFWSFAYKDWISDEQPTQDYAMNKIMGQLHPGSVILLHPKSNTNTAIFGKLIKKMKDRGYSFRTLDQFPKA